MDTATAQHTALYDRHVALGARMAEFAGFQMPMWYEGIKAEHEAVRTRAGLFDLSHMGEFFIEGREAFDLVQYLTCNDLRRIGDGGCQYTLFPTPDGGVVDDLIAYQYNPEKYMLVVNASNIAKDLAWVNQHNKFDCIVTDRSDELSLVAVQGPRTDEILNDFGLKNIACQSAFTFKQTKVQGNKVIVAGTGYTGERGFELIVENDQAGWLWDRLMQIGEGYGAVPVGLGARDTLRLEMAYSLYGNELSNEISVLEANLGWTLKLNKGEFLGKEYLAKQHENGVERVVAGLVVDGNSGSPRHGAPVFAEHGEDIGTVTSGSFSPSLNKGIALALIKREHTVPGSKALIEIRGKRMQAEVTELPFYRPRRG